MGRYSVERAQTRIGELACHGLDLVGFWREAGEIVGGVVPHYLAPCWFTFDPASLLVTSHFDHDLIPELPPEWLAHEYFEDDVHKMADVARSATGVSTLHEASGGNPGRSPAWNRYIQPYGGDQELLVALRTPSGEAWGMLTLYREPGAPMFAATEIAFLTAVAPGLAEGVQRGLLIGEATEPDLPDSPGLVVLRDDWSVESVTPSAERLLDELPGGDWRSRERLPPAVPAVAGRVLDDARDDPAGRTTVARVLSRAGRWVVLHGAPLNAGGARRVAVILEPAGPGRISPLLMAAYGLTERERDVTRLVLCGDSTAGIAATLSVSPHTVQQHLKNIFEKTGVRSRRDLVGKVFFAHYEPRLRDNERRTVAGLPARGGPFPA